MFLSTDDIVALHSQVSELHRARLQAQLAERQAHLDSLTNNAANENT